MRDSDIGEPMNRGYADLWRLQTDLCIAAMRLHDRGARAVGTRLATLRAKAVARLAQGISLYLM